MGAKGQRSDKTWSTENSLVTSGCFLSTKQWRRWQLPPRDSHRDTSPYTPFIAPVEQKGPFLMVEKERKQEGKRDSDGRRIACPLANGWTIPWCQITSLFPVSTLAFFEVPLLEPQEQRERLECLVSEPCRNSGQPR